ncbi:hypothetical protein LY76DRAFT_639599 [Colletotrichum caudatum]|nr:hypothetical protein LY76DRAFT_639599 [Colletotrichum caudatum]
MLLNNLSDRVAPFAKNLEIAKRPKPWPNCVPGQPRRASVNSFGFGGANAHAILESYEPAGSPEESPAAATPSHLDRLPNELRPDWSLEAELLATGDALRVTKGAYSSLSTAVQFVLVDLLRLAGVEFEAIRFVGRVCVAAVNSSSSVTLSGDEDAIDEFKVILVDEKRFNRKLRVDKAYHSNHLLHCAAPYVNAIRAAGVQAMEPASKCLWFSSVYCRPATLEMNLSDEYWAVNMIRPVLFHGALKAALEAQEYGLVVEVGPHPALKGPASQTIQEVLGKALPYEGVLSRGSDAVSSTASCLGFLWSHLGEKRVNLHRYGVANQPFNELLGDLLPDSAPHRLSWKHLLRVVQSQTVFRAAGYVCTALEGARILAGEPSVHLFELKDFIIHQAVTFNQDDSGIEILTCLSDIRRPSKDRIQANFTYSASLGNGGLTPCLVATLGYGFEGSFRSLSSLRRKLDISVCAVKSAPRDTFGPPLLVYPAEFDGAIQSLILAYSYPGDDQILTMHLPTLMGSIRINPTLCSSMTNMSVDSKLGARETTGFLGDVNLYTNDSRYAATRRENVELVPLGAATVGDDKKVFSKYHWVKNYLDGEIAASDTTVSKYHKDILMALERISTYYLRQFDLLVPAGQPFEAGKPSQPLLAIRKSHCEPGREWKAQVAKKEWLKDSLQDMLQATAEFSDLSDVRVMHLVGQQMPRVFKGETSMLEEFRVNNVLDDDYAGGFGFLQSGLWMNRTITQLAER